MSTFLIVFGRSVFPFSFFSPFREVFFASRRAA
jgi:hypothetical protein